MFVKDRTGQTRAVADNYVLRDGESVAVGFMAMDASPGSATPTDDLYRRLVIDNVEDAASVEITGRNGPPVTIKDNGPERSAEFVAGAAFASQEFYERRIGDAWRNSDTDGSR